MSDPAYLWVKWSRENPNDLEAFKKAFPEAIASKKDEEALLSFWRYQNERIS